MNSKSVDKDTSTIGFCCDKGKNDSAIVCLTKLVYHTPGMNKSIVHEMFR